LACSIFTMVKPVSADASFILSVNLLKIMKIIKLGKSLLKRCWLYLLLPCLIRETVMPTVQLAEIATKRMYAGRICSISVPPRWASIWDLGSTRSCLMLCSSCITAAH
jgi:hypothetical protein